MKAERKIFGNNIVPMLLVLVLWAGNVRAQDVSQYTQQIRSAYDAANYAEVVTLCDNAIALASKGKDTNALTLARLNDFKGMSLRMLGNYEGAEKCYINETELLTDFPSRADDVKCKLGVLYNEMGQFAKAEDILNLVQTPNKKGWSMLHLASTCIRRGDKDDAISLLTQVINGYPSQSDLLISAHQNIGFIQMDSKDKNEQKSAYEHLNYALNHLDKESNAYHATLGNCALLEARMGMNTDAMTHISEVQSWYEKKGEKQLVDYMIVLRKKAEILLMMGHRAEAQKVFGQYYKDEKAFATRNFITMTEQNRLDFWKTLKPNISKIFALENDCPDFLLDVALFRREVALLGDADKSEMTRRLNINGQQIRKALKTHELAIDFVRYEKDDCSWYGAIVIPSAAMKSAVQFVPLWKEDELHGFLVDGTFRLDDGLCSSNMNDKDRLYTDPQLMDYIWNKLDAILEGYDYEDVYFAPDGLLHLLAIEYLREDNGVFLHRLTSLSKLLDRNKHIVSKKSKMLAAGGLDYNVKGNSANSDEPANHDAMTYLRSHLRNPDNPFAYLNGARVEIDSIGRVSPFVTDTTTNQSEDMLKQVIKKGAYSILHLSTHGYALDIDVPKVPEALRDSITEDRSLLASGIALTGANVAYTDARLNDGIISAREFCEMDMSSVDLLVLSACQTGLGRFNDEGPAGLVRGLKKAGAGSLVVSLWSVSDEATMLFMKHLYKAMSEQSKLDIHAAFNAARINFSREYKIRRRFDSGRLSPTVIKQSFNLPRYCNSFILIDAIK